MTQTLTLATRAQQFMEINTMSEAQLAGYLGVTVDALRQFLAEPIRTADARGGFGGRRSTSDPVPDINYVLDLAERYGIGRQQIVTVVQVEELFLKRES